MAKELTTGKVSLDDMRAFAHQLRAKHCMFATSEDFKNLYSIELSLWTYGMPMSAYNDMLDIYSMPHLPAEPVKAEVERRVNRDIPDLGEKGMSVLRDPGMVLTAELEGCIECQKCVKECPEKALRIEGGEPPRAIIRSDLCMGTACKRCELVCPKHVISLKALR
jgi:methylamine methyltransferase corrinoid activation protein